MRPMRKAALVGAVVLGSLVPAQAASSHAVHVATPSGQSHCQNLGSFTGNFGHAGHVNGHPVAIAHQSGAASFGALCPQ